GSARRRGRATRPRWPMIVFRSPKGWTGPKEVDGLPVEGTWRSHQVPVDNMTNPEHLRILEQWLRSYQAEELFDDDGAIVGAVESQMWSGPDVTSPRTGGGWRC